MDLDTENPTHDQIWDDSALVDSWNQALAEYQKYHSIHAKGGAVEDLLDAEQQETKTMPQSSNAKPETPDPIASETPASQAPQDANKAPSVAPPMGGGGMPVMAPQVLLGSVQDEGLKRLLMSWYYAGYYTGLYEGKQQAEQAK